MLVGYGLDPNVSANGQVIYCTQAFAAEVNYN